MKLFLTYQFRSRKNDVVKINRAHLLTYRFHEQDTLWNCRVCTLLQLSQFNKGLNICIQGPGVPFLLSPGPSVLCYNKTVGELVSSHSPHVYWMDPLYLRCRGLGSYKDSQPCAGTLSPAWPSPHFFLLPGYTLGLVHCLPCCHGYQWTLLPAPGSAPHIQPLRDCAPLWSAPQFLVPCLPALAALWQ